MDRHMTLITWMLVDMSEKNKQILLAWSRLALVLLEMLLANQICVFFNHQYLLNGLKHDFDFMHVDKHEWKEQKEPINFGKTCFAMAENAFGQSDLRIL